MNSNTYIKYLNNLILKNRGLNNNKKYVYSGIKLRNSDILTKIFIYI